jgi:hypothetical protein
MIVLTMAAMPATTDLTAVRPAIMATGPIMMATGPVAAP